MVGFDGSFGDGQSQTMASGVADMVEWLEHLIEQLGRYAGACVLYRDQIPGLLLVQADADLGTNRCVLEGIANQIVEGPPQEFAAAGEQTLLLGGDLQEQRVILILETDIIDQAL